jgi:beta-phosphoglucomutase-like phosphatase (HAD superfamily)
MENSEIEIFRAYLKDKGYKNFDLKAVLFDMDGVLYDSMKYHARSWQQTMSEFGYTSTPEEFYLHEGRTGGSTIDILTRRCFGRNATDEEKKKNYSRKSELFTEYNNGETIPYAFDMLKAVKDKGLDCVLVTGSGQKSLLGKLDDNFPGIFSNDKMVTAFDVKKGKPDPEPYLMGLERGGLLNPNQAIVV